MKTDGAVEALTTVKNFAQKMTAHDSKRITNWPRERVKLEVALKAFHRRAVIAIAGWLMLRTNAGLGLLLLISFTDELSIAFF